MWERKGVYRILGGANLRGRDHLEHPGRRIWEDNIKIDLQKIVYAGTDWIELV